MFINLSIINLQSLLYSDILILFINTKTKNTNVKCFNVQLEVILEQIFEYSYLLDYSKTGLVCSSCLFFKIGTTRSYHLILNRS